MEDRKEPEPRVRARLEPLVAGDLHALSPACARDPQYNDRRLELRRKLLGLAKVFVGRAAGGEPPLALDARTSLHHPHAFNGNQVKRMWAYICRAKAEKTRLRRTIGADLAKDLDAAFRNAYLCVAVEPDAIETSLRIHADAWYDGQNLKHRVAAEGAKAWVAVLNELPGYRLRLADWRGEWRCGELEVEQVEEFLGYYVPGEHSLAVEMRMPVPAEPGAREAVLGEDLPERLVEELGRLGGLYRFAAWSRESDFLFSR